MTSGFQSDMQNLEVPSPHKKKKVEQTESQQHFLDPSKNWGHRINCWSGNWRDKTDRYREFLLEQKPTAGTSISRNTLKCNWWIAGSSVWTSWKAQKRPSLRPVLTPSWDLPPEAPSGSHWGFLRKIPSCFLQEEGGSNHFETCPEFSVLFNKACLQGELFYQDPTHLGGGEYPTPAHSSLQCGEGKHQTQAHWKTET